MRSLQHIQICILVLTIILSPTSLCFGGNVKKKSLYEKIVSLEQEKNWMMLAVTGNRAFEIYFIGPKEDKKVDINLFTPAQWLTKQIQGYTLSPDGSNISFVISDTSDYATRPRFSFPNALYVLSVKDSQIKNIIPPEKFSIIRYLCYSPEGERLYFIGKIEDVDDEFSLYSIELQTREITELVKGAASITTQACSPDGKEIVYKTTDDYIVIYNTETRSSRRITKGWYPVWSPNGKSIAFVDSPKENNFYTIQPDGSGKELLLRNKSVHTFKLIGEIIGYINSGMLWSPDGNYIYYERAGVYSIIDTAEHPVAYVMDVKTKKSIRLPKAIGGIKSWVGKI